MEGTAAKEAEAEEEVEDNKGEDMDKDEEVEETAHVELDISETVRGVGAEGMMGVCAIKCKELACLVLQFDLILACLH
jgi:hypothetical protein